MAICHVKRGHIRDYLVTLLNELCDNETEDIPLYRVRWVYNGQLVLVFSHQIVLVSQNEVVIECELQALAFVEYVKKEAEDGALRSDSGRRE